MNLRALVLKRECPAEPSLNDGFGPSFSQKPKKFGLSSSLRMPKRELGITRTRRFSA